MNLQEQVKADVVLAMKAKEAAKLSTLRLLKSALTNKEIESGAPLTDEVALVVVKAQVKQLKDSQASYEAANRADDVASVKAEVAVLEAYLPAQMSDDALRAAVSGALSAAGISAKADMGKAMGIGMKAAAGQADGARVKAMVESILVVFVLLLILAPTAALAATNTGISPLIPLGIKIFRAFLLMLGIVCVNMILMGGFEVMVAGGRDDGHHHGMEKMTTGFIGSMVIAALFSAATVAIDQL